MTKRDLLGYAALMLGTATVTGILWYMLVVPTTLRVAVAPAGGETNRLMAAVAAELERQRRPIRLVVVGHDDRMEPARLLDARRVDVAEVRPDFRIPATGLGVATLQQHVILGIARKGVEITQFAELRGRRVGTIVALRPTPEMINTFRAFESPAVEGDGPELFQTIEDFVTALAESRIDGGVFVARRADPTLARLIARIAERTGEPPTALPIRGASAFAEGQATYAAGEITAGEVSRVPQFPSETIATVTFPSLLVARSRISENAIEELTRQLFALRPALTAEHPLATRIEALSTERGSGIAVHPGAATYYDANERGFLDRYSDLLWLALFGFGGVASAGAFILRALFPPKQDVSRTDHARFAELLIAARRAETLDGLADVERQIDEFVSVVSLQMIDGTLDKELKPAFDLMIDQIRLVVSQRRVELRTTRGEPAAAIWSKPEQGAGSTAASDAPPHASSATTPG